MQHLLHFAVQAMCGQGLRGAAACSVQARVSAVTASQRAQARPRLQMAVAMLPRVKAGLSEIEVMLLDASVLLLNTPSLSLDCRTGPRLQHEAGRDPGGASCGRARLQAGPQRAGPPAVRAAAVSGGRSGEAGGCTAHVPACLTLPQRSCTRRRCRRGRIPSWTRRCCETCHPGALSTSWPSAASRRASC